MNRPTAPFNGGTRDSQNPRQTFNGIFIQICNGLIQSLPILIQEREKQRERERHRQTDGQTERERSSLILPSLSSIRAFFSISSRSTTLSSSAEKIFRKALTSITPLTTALRATLWDPVSVNRAMQQSVPMNFKVGGNTSCIRSSKILKLKREHRSKPEH